MAMREKKSVLEFKGNGNYGNRRQCVWAGAGLQRAAYRGGGTACYIQGPFTLAKRYLRFYRCRGPWAYMFDKPNKFLYLIFAVFIPLQLFIDVNYIS